MLKEVTPAHLRCAFLNTCPAVYEGEDGDLVIIGKKPTQEIVDELRNKVGDDELIITISRKYFDGIAG